MSKIIEYSKNSDLMKIKIEYGGKVYGFNLDEELQIAETFMAKNMKNQPRQYAFLAMLHKKLIILSRDTNQELSRKKNELMAKIKPNFSTVKEADAHVAADKSVVALQNKLLRIDEMVSTMEVAVRAFEMRKDLLQTLSANIRKERV